MSKSIKFFIVWTVFVLFLLTFISIKNPAILASAKMLWLLAIMWIGVFGSLSYLFKNKFTSWISKTSNPGKIFVLLSTLFVLIEEAIATFISNLNIQLGGTIETKLLTASTNYFEVILFHSVVAIIPMLIVWSIILKRYSFRPIEVMILFGISGILAEFIFGGFMPVVMGGFWILVYGLMVYLPAYAFEYTERQKPKIWHFLMAIIFPILGSVLGSFIINAFFR